MTLSSTYCFPWWFLPLCATRVLSFIYFGLSGFPLSLVYSLVVFATLCRQGFVMLFFNWWFSTFNCLFPGGFCHSVPPGLCHVIFQLVVFHFQLFIPWWFLPLCATRVVVLNSNKHFPSSLSIKDSSLSKLSSVAQRIY